MGGNGAEGGGEDARGELEEAALWLRNEATGEHGGERELVAKLFVKLGVEVMRRLAGEKKVERSSEDTHCRTPYDGRHDATRDVGPVANAPYAREQKVARST